MWFIYSYRIAKRFVHRIVYAYALIMLVITIVLPSVGQQHFKYQFDFGNMSEAAQVGATPQQLAALKKADNEDLAKMKKTRGTEFLPTEKPPVPKVGL